MASNAGHNWQTDNIVFGTGTAGSFSVNADHGGYFIGAGLDWALDQNWILGVEYNHIVLDGEMHLDTIPALGLLDLLVDDVRIDTVSARLTYKF